MPTNSDGVDNPDENGAVTLLTGGARRKRSC
jgi:hypothetical protein